MVADTVQPVSVLQAPTLSTSQESTMAEEIQKLKQECEALKRKNITLTADNEFLQTQNSTLDKELKKEKKARQEFERKAEHYEDLCNSYKKGEKLPKNTEDIVTRKRLADKLSEGQLDCLLNNAKKSRKWTEADFCKAEKLRGRELLTNQ